MRKVVTASRKISGSPPVHTVAKDPHLQITAFSPTVTVHYTKLSELPYQRIIHVQKTYSLPRSALNPKY